MGNQQSTEAFAQILVQTDKPYYFSGDTVTGHVFLNVERPGYPGTMVVLRILGYEECVWWENRNTLVRQNKQKWRWVWLTNRNKARTVIYKNAVSLHSFNESSIPIGQYSFPFRFELQEGIPASYKRKSFLFDAKIKYSLIAEVETNAEQYRNKQIKQDFKLNIRQPQQSSLYSLLTEQQTNVKSWCCINKGSCSLKASIDRNQYQSGDLAIIKVQIDNSKCNLAVQQIVVKLVSLVTLSKNTKTILFKRTVSSQSIPAVAGMQPRSLGSDLRTVKLPLLEQDKNESLQSSTIGKNISCQYDIVVELEMDGVMCWKNVPSVEIPVFINGMIDANPQVVPPQNWGPKEYELSSIKFDENNVITEIDAIEEELLKE